MNTPKQLRAALAECFVDCREGRLSGDALRGVIGCANQINMSIQAETKLRAQLQREGHAMAVFGEMEIA